MQQLLALDLHCPLQVALFCVGRTEQPPFTREHVVQRLQTLGKITGLGVGSLDGHSFRWGAATWAAEVGLPKAQIQTLRRSRSDAYKIYIEYSQEELIGESKHFQGTQPRHGPY